MKEDGITLSQIGCDVVHHMKILTGRRKFGRLKAGEAFEVFTYSTTEVDAFDVADKLVNELKCGDMNMCAPYEGIVLEDNSSKTVEHDTNMTLRVMRAYDVNSWHFSVFMAKWPWWKRALRKWGLL